MAFTEQEVEDQSLRRHRLSWADLDDLAQGVGGARVVGQLRAAELSRRKLLLLGIVQEVVKDPRLAGPLSDPESACELLARVEHLAPDVLNLVLMHPHTGSWLGYVTRLLRRGVTGTLPLWMHIGYVHGVAAAAAIRANMTFQTEIPVWHGDAVLPTLGLARLSRGTTYSVAGIRGTRDVVEISDGHRCVRLPCGRNHDRLDWSAVHQLTARAGGRELSVRLDDLDPYRSLDEPVPAQRLDTAELGVWRRLLTEAWELIAGLLPDMADAMSAGLESLTPRPAVPFRTPSGSGGEAFGSAIIAQPADAAALASVLVHEFQHSLLSGLLHLTPLHNYDQRERFYVPWREDPRPIGGVFQGIYAFFGVTGFWRALARATLTGWAHRSAFEFAHWRAATWRALCGLRADPGLTDTGRRFLDRSAELLSSWQTESVPTDIKRLADAALTDHRATWRLRHLRPDSMLVAEIAAAWPEQRWRPAHSPDTDPLPTPVPDGAWSSARTDLLRLRLTERDQSGGHWRRWRDVPNVTSADLAYVEGRHTDAVRGYLAELTVDADRPASWVGLGLACAVLGRASAARALLHRPELVRAVHRELRTTAASAPEPDALAAWIGRFLH